MATTNFEDLKLVSCDGSASDFEKLRKIHRVCMQENIVETLGKWEDEFQVGRLQKHYAEFSSTLNFVYLKDELIGTINFHPKVFKEDNNEISVDFFEQLYILPQHQRKGIGSHLMNTFKPEKEVRLSVLKKDKKAQDFYVKNGYQQYHEDYYQVFFKKFSSPKNKISI